MTTYAAGGYVAAPPTSAPYRAGPATPSMVADQLDALLGEHLMPLRVRSADGDASHLAAFRLTVPSTALLSTFVRGGARLLLVCSQISAGMEDVLEFLLQPGWQVDVLRAEVFTEPDGRRVVELSPVARSVVPQRIVDSPAWARGLDPDPFPAPFDPTPLARPVPLIVPPSFAVPLTQLDTDAPDPLLAAVAAALAGPAVLVWAPEGAAECLEALLHEDGIVELADGRQYGDVETATRAVSGLRGPLDAWQVWHVDSPSGPTLADLAAGSFPGQF